MVDEVWSLTCKGLMLQRTLREREREDVDDKQSI